ncbi:MAG: hypothetical protein ACJ0BV_11600 [Paracoccaceae bacterium]
MYYYDVCEPGYWWVTTAIEVIFVMLLIVVALWIVRQWLGIWNELFRRKRIVYRNSSKIS